MSIRKHSTAGTDWAKLLVGVGLGQLGILAVFSISKILPTTALPQPPLFPKRHLTPTGLKHLDKYRSSKIQKS
jgi:hypothetical protein